MLTGNEIVDRYQSGQIVIKPFEYKNVNPNSYNLTLAPELKVYVPNERFKKLVEEGLCDLEKGTEMMWYDDEIKDIVRLDVKKKNLTATIKIPERGYLLRPDILYLAKTNEYTETHDLIPFINGRSSLGRLGLFCHVTAGFGDIGFCGNWTLELTVVQPLRIYPNMKICQLSYYEPVGSTHLKYKGKYQGDKDISESKLYKEF